MDDFKFTPDEVQPISSNDDLGFSFTPDSEQPDFAKLQLSDIKTSNDPVGDLTQSAKSILNKINPKTYIDAAADATASAIYKAGKSLIDNKEIVGEYIKKAPVATIGLGVKLAETAKSFYKGVESKLEEEELYQFQGDTKLSALKEGAKALGNEAFVVTPKIASEITYWLSKNMTDPDGKDNMISEGFAGLSTMFNKFSNYMGDVDLFKSTAINLPSGRMSWGNIGEAGGHGVGQGVVMGTTARLFGPKFAYGIYAMAGGASVFKESYEKEGDIGKANTLATITTATTYALDRWINPLPENIAKGAKITVKEILKDIPKSAAKEIPTETLQQVLSENLVRKIGIDAEQELYEGLAEVAISAAFGGASMAAAGGVGGYIADRSYEKAKQKAIEKGATESEIEQYKDATMEKFKNHADVFDAKFQANAEKAFNDLNTFIEQNGSEEEVRKAVEKKQQLEKIYNDSYNELKNIMPEQEAKSNAALIRNSAFFYANEFGISPEEFVKKRGVKVVKLDYKQFKGNKTTENMPIMQVTQRDINYARSHPEWAKNNALIQAIGQAGADISDDINTINKALKEYSIKEYNFRKNADEGQIKNFVAELDEGKQERYAMMVENGVKPQDAYNAVTYVEDYIPFQTGVSEIDSSQLYQNLPQDLKNAVDFIYTSAPVYEVTGKEFPNDGTSLNKRVLQYFTDKFQNVIDVSDLGEVLLDARSIKDSTIHGLSSNKANAFAAVPYVLKNGKMFLSQEHYEGKNENRYVFIAPIKLKNEDYFCEVVVRQGIETQKGVEKLGKRRFYIHEVELIKKLSDDFTTFQQGSSSSSKSIISKQINDVKKNMQSQGGVQFQESLNVAVENAELDKVNPAYEGETININGVERTVYNSNGDRIAMSEPALRNFYKWFGDSKVVDEQGRPLVVYHGTTKGGFNAFDANEIGSNTGNAEIGFFFGDYGLAKTYTDNTEDFTEGDTVVDEYGEYEERSGMYAVYLKADEVDVWDFHGANWDGIAYGKYALRNEEEYDWLRDEEGSIVLFDSLEEMQNYVDEHPEAEEYTQWDDPQILERTDDLATEAEQNGFDGVIFKNIQDQGKYAYGGEEGNVYVVFNPNQIKSTSNRGTYSESDNIYFQSAFAGSRVDYDRPSLEAIGSGEGAQAHGWGLYYALNRDVAERYRETFTTRGFGKRVKSVKYNGKEIDDNATKTSLLGLRNTNKENAIDLIKRQIKYADNETREKWEKLKDFIENVDESKIDVIYEKGQVHEVDIPENPYLLDEQKPFSEQSDYVKERLEKIISNLPEKYLENYPKMGLDRVKEIDFLGSEIYGTLEEAYGSPKEASKILEKYGIKGITYDGKQDGRCFVIFNPDDVKVIQKFYQDGANDPKGAYVNRIIHLFQNADASTLPHELAHFWKDTLKDAVKMSKRAAKMLEDVEKWAEQEFNRKYSIQKRGAQYVVVNKQGLVVYGDRERVKFYSESDARSYAHEEIFAQGFETYLKEGVAPNNSLKQAFRNFLMWIKHLINQGKVLDIRLSPDIKNVFADILGGTEIDFFLNTDPDTFIENRIKRTEESEKDIDEQITEAQRNGVTRSKVRRALKDAGKYWQDAVVPLSTRLKRINPKLRTKIRRYEFDVVNNLNKYYQEVKPFLDIWQKFSETDAIAFDIALKNDYVKKQLEIVDKYGAREEWEKVHKTLLDIYDNGISAGLDINYRPDYFPRAVEDYDGFMTYMQGRPDWSVFEQALKEADPEGKYSTEEKAEFINKYFRGFVKADIMPSKFGSEKQRKIDHVTNEMNQYYKPSIEALIGYIEGMNARIEASKFLGKDAENLDSSIGGFVDYLLANKEIEYKDVDTVKRVLKARFSQKGVGNAAIAALRDVSYLYTMGGINSAITQIEDISVSLYENGLKNTFKAAVKKKDIKRSDLGLEKIGQEFIDNPSKTAAAVDWTFKATGLDKIDAWGKETFVNAKISQYEQMSDEELREYIEPIMEQDTNQVIKDIRNGVRSDDVLFLAYNELSNYQPISLSELPAYYNVGGNWRVVYMLKSFMLKRIDIFRNECYDKIFGDTDTKTKIEGVQNLFRLAILMVMCGVTKDWIINFLYNRVMDLSEAVVNNLLGLAGISKFHLYQARDKGIEDVIKDFLFPPILAPWHDFGNDISRFVRGKTDIKDFEVAKGIPLIGRFYYWHIGRGKEKMKKKNKSKLK